ncbi:hypothetical protein OXPF_14070 [Oxobacter pfennigii]|uniref:Pilus assembly protein, PilO n=1 Tax=Oxobacter pfennigii TaxID=36849 RepID=A0A0P8YYQ6_9CLOT|nr:hypothetical protein [Oxobacter pfennigii]KPU44929.1 hypothetical protein OXPF_14070 [Oxobacter pfennigii]
MILSKRENILVFLSSISLFVFLYYQSILEPLIKNTVNTYNTLETNRQILNDLKLKKENMDTLTSQVDLLAVQALKYDDYIPPFRKISDIIKEIEAIALESSCTIEKLNIGTPLNNDNETENINEAFLLSTLNYNIRGEYKSIISFLNKIEYNINKMSADNLTIIRDENAESLIAILDINFLYLKEEDSYFYDYPIQGMTSKENMFE